MKPKILFLMAQYPDVDHLVPVADLLAETGKYEVGVLTYQDRINFDADPRILYLKRRHGISVKPLSDYYPFLPRVPWKLYQWRAYWGLKCKDTRPYYFLGRNLKSLLMPRFHIFRISRFLVDRILSRWLGNSAWGNRVCEEEKPSVVVIDHAYTTYWIESFIKQIKSSGIPTIAFPHSSFMFTHTHVLKNEKGVPLAKTNEEEFPWDCVVVESGMRVSLLNELGVPTKRMYPLGCVRFTHWWINKFSYSDVPFPRYDHDQRPMVLYLASSPSVTVKKGVECLREVMDKYKDRLRFVVKAHSRRDRTELFKSFSDLGIEVIGGEISSPTLIEAADYILVTASSVVIDAMLRGKPIVYAKLTTDNEPLFSKYVVFPAVKTEDDLDRAFGEMARRAWEPGKSADRMHAYLRDCVHGGYGDEESLLRGCLELFSVAVDSRSVEAFTQWMSDRSTGLFSRLDYSGRHEH